MPGPHLQVREYDTLVRGGHDPARTPNVAALPPEAFDAVQALLLDPRHELNPVAHPTRLGGRSALKLTQWVGVLRAPDGTTVEILPKTHERPGGRTGEGSLERSRGLLLRMLAAADERFRVAPPAELQTARMPLHEVVIRYVLEGIRAAVRPGIPHAYVPVQEERAGLRGRPGRSRSRLTGPPPAARHLRRIPARPPRSSPDPPGGTAPGRADPRARKSAADTRTPARPRRGAAEQVPPSRHVAQDFAAWRLGRGHAHFAPLEGLCRMVLYELNPVVAGTQPQAQALLFDMNTVYEAYVARLLQRLYPGWRIETQVTGRVLGHSGGVPAFWLRPDLLIHTAGGRVIVADTKWKRLKPGKAPTYDVSGADADQMSAYSQVFQSGLPDKPMWLIYPHLPGLAPVSEPIYMAIWMQAAPCRSSL